MIKISNLEADLGNFTLQNGDIIIVPHLFLKGRRFDYSLNELQADTLFSPTQKNEVYVTGTVGQWGTYPYYPNYTIRDFVNTAGMTELSSRKGIYVLTADGKYIHHPDAKKDFHLSPGDTIVVPKKAWTTDNVLRWYNTLTGTVFTSFAFKQLIKGQ